MFNPLNCQTGLPRVRCIKESKRYFLETHVIHHILKQFFRPLLFVWIIQAAFAHVINEVHFILLCTWIALSLFLGKWIWHISLWAELECFQNALSDAANAPHFWCLTVYAENLPLPGGKSGSEREWEKGEEKKLSSQHQQCSSEAFFLLFFFYPIAYLFLAF